MSRYLKLVLVMLLVAIAVSAQEIKTMPAAEDYTDEPITAGWWYEFNLRFINPTMYSYRSWTNVISILQDLATGIHVRGYVAGEGLDEGYWTEGWQAGTDPSAIRTAASSFLNRFPSTTEVYTQTLGGTGDFYIDAAGNVNMPSEDEVYGQNFHVSQTHSYNYYAGRTASRADDQLASQIELTTYGKKYVVNMYATTTPLVFDLNGDDKLDTPGGIMVPSTVAKDAKLVPFDMTGDGFEELVEWLGPNDGLLLVYRPGELVNGNDLFGTAGGFCHGYEKLSVLDVNKDGVLTEKELATLSIWQDKNSNAVADQGEVKSVKDLGITSISIQHNRLISSFVRNGETRKIWDWSPVTILVKKTR